MASLVRGARFPSETHSFIEGERAERSTATHGASNPSPSTVRVPTAAPQAVGIEPDPPDAHGGAGASTDQVAVPAIPPFLRARVNATKPRVATAY